MARLDLDGTQLMAPRDALWIARSALECAGSTALWIGGLGARRLDCASDRRFGVCRFNNALDWRIRCAHAGPVWSAQTRLRSGFPRDAGAETPRSCPRVPRHPERRRAAALQSASRPTPGTGCTLSTPSRPAGSPCPTANSSTTAAASWQRSSGRASSR